MKLKKAGLSNIFILMVIFLSFGESILAQTPTVEMTSTPTLTSTSSVRPILTRSLAPTSTTNELNVTISPTKAVTPSNEVGCPPTVVPTATKETPKDGGKTLFWAAVVISGAGILWVVGELLGPSDSTRTSPPEKKNEYQDF